MIVKIPSDGPTVLAIVAEILKSLALLEQIEGNMEKKVALLSACDTLQEPEIWVFLSRQDLDTTEMTQEDFAELRKKVLTVMHKSEVSG